ncbi:hypothetical protein [Phenylobacterium sp.]|jgi:hypothetical protein|uniref:hypothetical protein n=1 Tax=Phenylobacterium sp. TaxID=1871053 RepID=UPI002F41712B
MRGLSAWPAAASWRTHKLQDRSRRRQASAARNLFDKNPPQISSGFDNRVGNAPLYSGFDCVGRRLYVTVSKSF